MADSKLTALTSETTVAMTDIVYFVDDPSGTPLSRKCTVANLTKGIDLTNVPTASGAITIRPASASSLNVTLATTGDFVVNTTQFFVDTSAACVGIGTPTPQNTLQVSVAASELGRIQSGGNATGTTGAIFGYDAVSSGRASITQLNNAGGTASTIAFGFGAISSGFPINTVLTFNQSANVGIGITSPNANAILDVTSTTKAFMPPRMTTAQKNAIASPTAGMVVYDSSLGKLCVYTTAWETITSA